MDVAYALQKRLEYESDPTVWDQGIFRPMRQALVDLVKEAASTDFGIFIFSPDDIADIRGETRHVVRDNVLFELGLFIGAIGVERCFIVAPRGAPSLRMPSDLLGLTPITFAADRNDGRLHAALGPASHEIKQAIRLLGKRRRIAPQEVRSIPKEPSPLDVAILTDKFIEDWESPTLVNYREKLRAGVAMHILEDADGDARQAARSVFRFLDNMSEALLAGRLDETRCKAKFEKPVQNMWAFGSVYFAPLNQADEAWDPLPAIAQLDRRWRRDDL